MKHILTLTAALAMSACAMVPGMEPQGKIVQNAQWGAAVYQILTAPRDEQ